LRRNCLLKHVIEGKIGGRIEMTGRRERRRKQLLAELKEKGGYFKWKGEALGRIICRIRFGRGYGCIIYIYICIYTDNTSEYNTTIPPVTSTEEVTAGKALLFT
jgi:hypothetical protein